jgi:hypothetical protein
MEENFKKNTIILPTAYFGNIDYWKIINESHYALIDINEQFKKQTQRNRTTILTSNGTLVLSIPLAKWKNHTLTKDIKISYTENWQAKHWRSIFSAYNNSPFFQFYKDSFYDFYNKKKHTFLIDFNAELFNRLSEKLKIQKNIVTTQISKESTNTIDYRELLSGKINTYFEYKKYFQVFEFKENDLGKLSILDLLFNTGPDAAKFLSAIKY